uniref:Uncharacterized protein n=1 Tax=viral metagenome TaxID=1070528 RepID=A0A6M3J738_9ZZZZ
MIHLFNIEIGQKPAVLALSIIIKNQEISSRIPLTLQEIIKIPPITGDFMTDFIQLQELPKPPVWLV